MAVLSDPLLQAEDGNHTMAIAPVRRAPSCLAALRAAATSDSGARHVGVGEVLGKGRPSGSPGGPVHRTGPSDRMDAELRIANVPRVAAVMRCSWEVGLWRLLLKTWLTSARMHVGGSAPGCLFGCRVAEASDSLSQYTGCPSLRRRTQALEGRLTEGFAAVRWVGLAPHAAHGSASRVPCHAGEGGARERPAHIVTQTHREEWDFLAVAAVSRLAQRAG